MALSERNHQLALTAQRHIETDAAERRVTDLYTKAAEQLGHADAAVRTAGLYALERVAQNNPNQRQAIVNVLCAYLRMPFTPPPASITTALSDSGASRQHQELQVRGTVQSILSAHLIQPEKIINEPTPTITPSSDCPFWPDIDLDLTRAHVGRANFSHATFSGMAMFTEATFTGGAAFVNTTFASDARFQSATFHGDVGFVDAIFTGGARFDGATFSGRARFDLAEFTGDTEFAAATFTATSRLYVSGARIAVSPDRHDTWPPGVQVMTDGPDFSRLIYTAPGSAAGQSAQTEVV